MTTIDRRFLVVGAGPTGLGAAVRLRELGEEHLVVEAQDCVGGMAASVTDERGFTWDLGGHVIHSHFAAFDDAVRRSGTVLRDVRRNGWVWIDGALVRAPIQKNLETLPDDLRPGAPAANLADYYRNTFGSELTGRFFAPFTEKMWGHPLECIEHSWTSLRNGSGDANVPRPGLARDHVPVDEYFPYPVGGAGALWESVAGKLVDPSCLSLSTRVIGLDLAARTARLDDGRHVRFEYCISTMPLSQLALWAEAEILVPTSALVARKVHAVGVGFTGSPPPALADKTWLYSPDPDVPWYRATVLSNYDPGNAGESRWNVLCESSVPRVPRYNLDEVIGRTVATLIALGAGADDIESIWTRTLPMGYPVPTLGRDDVLRQADDVLRDHGVYSRGRFGGWRYESCNQDYSFAQGIGAVDHALLGAEEDVYWHPELF